MQRARLSYLLIPFAALACGDSSAPAEDEFTVQSTGEEITLSNQAEKPTFYFIVERETATLLDFSPCVKGPECRSVAPGQTVRIPYRQITGYKPDRQEVIVYWWRSVLAPTGLRVDQLHNQIVEL
jgi:hypothetical protein